MEASLSDHHYATTASPVVVDTVDKILNFGGHIQDACLATVEAPARTDMQVRAISHGDQPGKR